MKKFFISVITIIASIIAIFTFLTGFSSLQSFLHPSTDIDNRSILVKTKDGAVLKTSKQGAKNYSVRKYPFILKPPQDLMYEANGLANMPIINTGNFTTNANSMATSYLNKEMRKYLHTKKGRTKAEEAFFKTYGVLKEYKEKSLSNLIEVDNCIVSLGICTVNIIDNY